MIRVCDCDVAHHLLAGRHLLPLQHSPLGLTDDLADQRQDVIDLRYQALGLRLSLAADRSEGIADLLRLSDRGFRCCQQFCIDPFPLLGLILPDSPPQPVQRLQTAAHGSHPRPERTLHVPELLLDQRLAPSDGTSQYSHPIRQETAIGGMVDIRLHHRPIDSQLPACGDLRVSRQLDHPIIERMQGLGSNGLGPPLQGAEIGHGPKVDPTEPTQDDTVSYPLLGLAVAPIVEMFHDQQPEDRLTGGGVSAVDQRQTIARP